MKPVLAVIVAASLALGPIAEPVAAFPAEGAVTSLSVVPASGRAELVIGVAGGVDVSDFTLRSPDRIVLDVTGASLGFGARGYDHVARGGIIDVRFSQYRKNTVRVVIYLDSPRSYEVNKADGEVRVSVTTDPAAKFAGWHVGNARTEPAVADRAAPSRTGWCSACRSETHRAARPSRRSRIAEAESPAATPTSVRSSACRAAAPRSQRRSLDARRAAGAAAPAAASHHGDLSAGRHPRRARRLRRLLGTHDHPELGDPAGARRRGDQGSAVGRRAPGDPRLAGSRRHRGCERHSHRRYAWTALPSARRPSRCRRASCA